MENSSLLTISLSVLIWSIFKIMDDNFSIQKDLPFQLCYFVALILPLVSSFKKKIYFDILFFWILAGTLQAVLTPELNFGFPNYNFIFFWIIHAGLIIFIFYATFVYNLKPNIKSVLYSFLALQGYFLLAIIVNMLTGGNYFYLNNKPSSESILDLLGKWSYYILEAELLLISYFLIIYAYAPFYLTRKRVKSQY